MEAWRPNEHILDGIARYAEAHPDEPNVRRFLERLFAVGRWKRCPNCHRAFVPDHGSQVFCTRRCANAARQRRHRRGA